MELRVLSYFLMVAREENITKAAQLLHVTQPTLSRQLMQLEEELGVKLFERSSHSINLTDDGVLLKRRAQELVSLAEKTKQDFLRQEENLTGEIAIGGGELLSIDYFSGLLSSFREKHPLVRYDFYSGNVDNVKDYIERGLLDLGILIEPVDIRKYDFLRMPTNEEWGVLVRKDSDLAKKEFIQPEDLTDLPLIVPKGSLINNEIKNWFGDIHDRLEFAATYNLLYNAAIMVQKRIGVAVCIRLHSMYENLCYIPLSPKLEAGSVLVWKKDQPFSPATSAFIEHSKICLKSIT